MNPTIEQLGDRKFRISIDEREMHAYRTKRGVSRGQTINADTIADAEWTLEHRKATYAKAGQKVILHTTNLGAFFDQLPKGSHRKMPVMFKPKDRTARGRTLTGKKYVEYRTGLTVTFTHPKYAVAFKLRYWGVGAEAEHEAQ